MNISMDHLALCTPGLTGFSVKSWRLKSAHILLETVVSAALRFASKGRRRGSSTFKLCASISFTAPRRRWKFQVIRITGTYENKLHRFVNLDLQLTGHSPNYAGGCPSWRPATCIFPPPPQGIFYRFYMKCSIPIDHYGKTKKELAE